MELRAPKGVAYVLFVPLVDSAGALKTGAGAPDSEIATRAHGGAWSAFADCTNEVAESGTTGWYSLSLTAAEMNADYIAIQIKTSDALTQCVLIRTISWEPVFGEGVL
jgi:hypothetical protein